jgi:antitoxin component of RelBE/YafQ-DinJ toxin-antitoxin module
MAQALSSLTIRIDKELKDAARRRAEALGVSLSTLIVNDLRRFINGHPIVIDDDSYVPTERLLGDISQARAEQKAGQVATADSPDQITAFFDRHIYG